MSGAFVVSNVLDALAPRSTIPMSTSSNGPGTGTGARASSRSGDAGRGVDEIQASQGAALWPVKQRRRIDRIRDEKWGEFVKTINDQFEWLETYYQGCVVAANLQHKHQLENNGQQQHSQSGHPHLHPHPHQGQTDNPSSWGATSSTLGYDPSIYTTPEQRRQHDFLSTPPSNTTWITTRCIITSANDQNHTKTITRGRFG
ncbi:hypothetical protein DFQ26_008045 [Actinomortierella ambigua]|nr:hypothetical protein DFQ26_008045 [Actinomortierella ambigua]